MENNSNTLTSPKVQSYAVREAISAEQLDAVYRLRYKVFIEEDKKFNKATHLNEMIQDKYDDREETVNLIVGDVEEYVGTIRATIAVGVEQDLPCDRYYDGYKNMRSRIKGKYASVGMLAISRKNCNVKLLYNLIKELLKVGSIHQVDYALFPVNHKLQKTLEHLGARMVGEIIFNEHIGNYIAPMMLDIKKMAQRFRIKGFYTEEARFSISQA